MSGTGVSSPGPAKRQGPQSMIQSGVSPPALDSKHFPDLKPHPRPRPRRRPCTHPLQFRSVPARLCTPPARPLRSRTLPARLSTPPARRSRVLPARSLLLRFPKLWRSIRSSSSMNPMFRIWHHRSEIAAPGQEIVLWRYFGHPKEQPTGPMSSASRGATRCLGVWPPAWSWTTGAA